MLSKTIRKSIDRLRTAALKGGITRAQARSIGRLPVEALPELWAAASAVRDRFKGREIRMCSIVNAKSGRCAENCAFCAQSAHHKTGVKTYPLKSADALVKAGEKAFRNGACEFSIVTSGTAVNEREVGIIEKAVARLSRKGRRNVCASLGILPPEALGRLKKAGLVHFHHNLETSRGHFANICSTHAYNDSIRTVRAAAAAGLKVCCGGIFGMGEDWNERVSMVFEAKKLPAFSFPVNFLHPIPGTPLGKLELLPPIEALRIIALVRLSLPDRNVIICGGREKVLKELLPMIFLAGANGLLAGGYLTTKGRRVEDDIAMIRMQGFTIAKA